MRFEGTELSDPIQDEKALTGNLLIQLRQLDYRNPVLAEAMKVLGYVERFGVGIARAEAALRGNGNPPPEFVFEATHVLVTVRGRA